jgi:soluble lytic murein transglycosylase-like protein
VTAAPVLAALALAVPTPTEPISRDPARLAEALIANAGALDAAVDRWLRTGDPRLGEQPPDVTLLALYEQRAIRLLGRNRPLADRTLAWLPPPLRRRVDHLIVARRALSRLNPPVAPTLRLRLGPAAPAGQLRQWCRDAQVRFGVDWTILAAVNLVESAFGRVRSASSAGAQGPMQFLPATWRRYGLGGDVHDPHDAVLGAANYLRASGAQRDLRAALFAYNRSTLYVDAVLRYAAVMSRDRRSFYRLYSWQVIIRTTAGDRRLTGPGR